MNEIITRLKQQAGIDYNPDQEGLDLFAKLIIEECDTIIKYYKLDRATNSKMVAYNEVIDSISNNIKQYLGVDENDY